MLQVEKLSKRDLRRLAKMIFQFCLVATIHELSLLPGMEKGFHFQFCLVATSVLIPTSSGLNSLSTSFQFCLVATLVIIFPGCLNILWSLLNLYPNRAVFHRGTSGSVGIDQRYSVIVWLSGFPALIIAYIWAHETLFSSFTINNYCFGFFFYYAS